MEATAAFGLLSDPTWPPITPRLLPAKASIISGRTDGAGRSDITGFY